MKPSRPPGKIQALGAATVQALSPQRALAAMRKLKAAHERRTDARSNVQLRRAQSADLPALAAANFRVDMLMARIWWSTPNRFAR